MATEHLKCGYSELRIVGSIKYIVVFEVLIGESKYKLSC